MEQVTRARELLGVPWVHQGRDPVSGIDCVGLLILAFQIHEPYVYGRHPHGGMIGKKLREHFGEPVSGAPSVGDVLELGFGTNGVGRHVAIVADYAYGGLSLIHTDSVIGRVVELPLNDLWLRRIRAVYRKDIPDGATVASNSWLMRNSNE